MFCKNRSRILQARLLLLFWITTAEGQSCNDTRPWNNGHSHPCNDYRLNVSNHWWCPIGSYTKYTMWTGGDTFKYPELNCCACGKGWPLWFVPAVGYAAQKAIPAIKKKMKNTLNCNDGYRNTTACTMKCKVLANSSTIQSIRMFNKNDFNQFNCTLNLTTTNTSVQYMLRIPTDNYLIYFPNWTTPTYNFTCTSSLGKNTESMLCRYSADDNPIHSPQCPSNNITSRYIPPGCVDTYPWSNGHKSTCFDYEITRHWCANGRFTNINKGTGGPANNYPERNCCACGKGSLSPFQSAALLATNKSVSPSEFGIMHLKNCSVVNGSTYIFDITCLAPFNFTNTNITMNATLHNCPLDCFFDWNITQLEPHQSINVSRQSVDSSVWYTLKSELFSLSTIVCGSAIKKEQTSTHAQMTSTDVQTTKKVIAWQPIACTNGNIGPDCNVSIDRCAMTKPCLNNGTCLNTNASYICVCPLWKFTGRNCENDIRPCQPDTCLSRGTCNETSVSSLVCQCDGGYEGLHCESLVDYCREVSCQNNGQCRPSRSNFSCECTSKDVSGRYCEIRSSSSVVQESVKRSLGYIAIIGIGLVAGVVVFMDVLKYCFKIDPVETERKRLRAQKRRTQTMEKHPKIVRFIYVNQPTPTVTTVEEL